MTNMICLALAELMLQRPSKKLEPKRFEEYEALLEDTCGLHILFWESCYQEEGGTIYNQYTLETERRYYNSGLRVKKEWKQICDHLGFEAAFAAYLEGEEKWEYLSNHVIPLLRHIMKKIDRKRDEIIRMIGGETGSTLFYEEQFGQLLIMLKGEVSRGKDAERVSAGYDAVSCYFDRIKPGETFEPETRAVYGAGWNNCGGSCSMKTMVQQGNVISVKRSEPCSGICIRGGFYRQTFLSGERLRFPMKRVGKRGEGKFERISWKEALEYISSENKRIKETYGAESRYINYGCGISGIADAAWLAKRFLSLDGGYLGSYNNYSSACAEQIRPFVYGCEETDNSPCLLEESNYILLFGHNPYETIYDEGLTDYLLKAKERGIPVIVIDPRRSDTARIIGTEWIGIRPGTDGAMMDAMAYVILKEHLEDREFMDRCCIGFDEEHMPEGVPAGESYESYVFGKQDGIEKTPEWAEEITGVSADVIRRIAVDYAKAKPAALIQGLGNQRQSNGEQNMRSGAMLTCLTGNLGIAGGSSGLKGYSRQHRMPKLKREKNPYPGSIPVFLWTKAVENGLEMTAEKDGLRGVERLSAPIKMIWNIAGNTLINQHSDINRTRKILEDESLCECIIVSDIFMTPSAKFADIILPGVSFLEQENISTPWNHGDYFLYNNQAIEPVFEGRFEYQWLAELADKEGIGDRFRDGKESFGQWLLEAYEEVKHQEPGLPDYEEFCREGKYVYPEKMRYTAFENEVKNPEKYPFPTPSGKIEIFSERLYKGGELPGLARYTEGFEGVHDSRKEDYPLQLIGWHTRTRTHTVHDNNALLQKIEPQALWMNPVDGAYRGFYNGQMVEVFNDRGRVLIPVKLTEDIVPGVVAMAQGAWYTPDQNGIDTRGSINMLTTQKPTPFAKGNAQHSALVEVKGRIDKS